MLENYEENLNQGNLNVVQNIEQLDSINLIEPQKEKNTNKINKKTIILVFLGVLLVALIGVITHYLITLNNPKTVFVKSSNYLFEKVESMLKLYDVNFEDSILYTGKVEIDTTLEDLKFLNDETFNYSFGFDLKNKKAEYGIIFNEKNKELIDVKAEIKNNNIYVFLNEIFEKVIVIDESYMKENMNITINEIFTNLEELINSDSLKDNIYIVEQLKKITSNSLNKLAYEKESANIKIKDYDVKANKMIIKFTKENITTFVTNYIDEILKNEKLIEKITNLIELDKDVFIENLNTYKDEIKNMNDTDEIIQLAIYTNGLLGEIVKISVENNDEEGIYYINYKDYKSLWMDDILIEIDNKDLVIKSLDEVLVTGTINAFEKNNISFDFKTVYEEDITGSFIYTKNENNMYFNIKVSSSFEGVSMDFAYNFDKISEKESKAKIKVVFESGKDSIEVNNETKMLLGSNIATNEIKNTIDFNALTETHLETMTNNIQKILKDSVIGKYLITDIKNPNQFVSDTNDIIHSASVAMSLDGVGSINLQKETEATYCFTVNDLYNMGLLGSEYLNYAGTVTVTDYGNSYNYKIEMYDNNYYTIANDYVTASSVFENDYMPSNIKTFCGKYNN